MRKIRPFIALSAATILLAGCSAGKPKPDDYQIYSEADTLLNRDANARPLSVVLDIYQLRDRQEFSRLTFDDFVSAKTDTELLRDEMIQKTEIVVLPGEKRTLNGKVLQETKYLGVVAIYRMPAEQQWRYLIPAEQIRNNGFLGLSKKNIVTIRLHDCHIKIEGAQVDLIPGQKLGATPTCPLQTHASTTGEIAQ